MAQLCGAVRPKTPGSSLSRNRYTGFPVDATPVEAGAYQTLLRFTFDMTIYAAVNFRGVKTIFRGFHVFYPIVARQMSAKCNRRRLHRCSALDINGLLSENNYTPSLESIQTASLRALA
jgi:hypothetical protein